MKTPIAVIGMGCIFPDAMDLSEYWNNIVLGKDSIREIPDSYWLLEDYYDEERKKKDKTYSKKAGIVGDVMFDSLEFGIMPKDLESISVEQIFALVVAKQALIDAGLYGKGAKDFDRDKAGVILAAGMGKNAFSLNVRLQIPKFRKILRNSGVSEELTEIVLKKIEDSELEWTENSNPGYLPNVVAARVASRFNFYGNNCTVDAACASSFAALKCAINELESGDSDIVLTGGVNLDCSEFSFVSFCKTPAISPNDVVRPFDKNADGMVLGDGIGMIVLKRLKDAKRDKDKIYGVIRGVGSSGDGKGKGIFSPSAEGQLRALRCAYESAGVKPETVSLIEAHGTGTRVGDNYELEALNKFIQKDKLTHTIGVGSVKSQIGHTRLSAGIAGLIKVLLALQHEVQPGTLHVEEKSELFSDSCLDVIQKTKPWIVNDLVPVRRAGVSAFGFGGTNYHVVVEEWKEKDAYRMNATPKSIVLHGRTRQELLMKCKEVLDDLQTERNLNKFYGDVKIHRNEERIGFVALSAEEAKEKLEKAIYMIKDNVDTNSWKREGIYYRQKGIYKKDKAAMIVLKPGKQLPFMQNEVAINYPEMRESFRKADNVQIKADATLISPAVYPYDKGNEDAFQELPVALLANAAIISGLHKILRNRGFRIHYFLGWNALEDLFAYTCGNIKEKKALKRIREVGEIIAQKAKTQPIFERGCGNTRAVVYENDTGRRYPKIKKSKDVYSEYAKTEKYIGDCINFACDKGTSVFLVLNGTEQEMEQIRQVSDGKKYEMIAINTQKTEDTQVQLEEVITQLRVLGFKVKQDIYSKKDTYEQDKEKKHLIRVNPRVYRSEEKEKLVREALGQEKSEQTVTEPAKEVVIKSIDAQDEVSEKQSLPSDNKEKENKNKPGKRKVLLTDTACRNMLGMVHTNQEALHQYFEGHIKQMKELKDVLSVGVEQKEIRKIFEKLNKSNEKKIGYFREYFDEQNTQYKQLVQMKEPAEVYDIEFENIVQTRIKNQEMRELQVCLKELPAEKCKNNLLKGGVLVVLDQDGVALAVCDKLVKCGFSPILLKGEVVQCDTSDYPCYNMSVTKESDIKDLFDLIKKEQKIPVTGFLNIASTVEREKSIQAGYDQVKAIFLMAKYFYLQSEMLGSKDERKFFINVLRTDGKLGTMGEGTNLMSGGISGLGKSLADEWKEHTLVKVIDIENTCNVQQCSEIIMDELQYGNPLYADIGITSNKKRYFLGLEETTKRIREKNPLTEDDVILVTGGGQGITARCVIRLAEKYQCKFVILGRTVLKDDLLWLSSCKSKRDVQDAVIKRMREENKKLSPKEVAKLTHTYYSQIAIHNTMKAIKATGSKVLYYSCDVTDTERIGQIVKDVKEQFGVITGFVHGAGILADKYIHNKDEKDFDLVVGTKVLGLNACLGNLDLNQLKYIVLFSSVAAFFGNKGQTDYAIANEIFNKMSYLLNRSLPGCKTISINWGPWDGGMIDKSLKEALASRNISVIPFERGEEIFVEQFTYQKMRKASQIVIFDKMYF